MNRMPSPSAPQIEKRAEMGSRSVDSLKVKTNAFSSPPQIEKRAHDETAAYLRARTAQLGSRSDRFVKAKNRSLPSPLKP
jgi:hypothetical protein